MKHQLLRMACLTAWGLAAQAAAAETTNTVGPAASAVAVAQADNSTSDPTTAPGLLPTAIARALLDPSPSVQAARAELDAARQEAQQLESSPHEWTVKLLGQRRAIDQAKSSNEWNAGVERAWRLPGKAAADRKLAAATIEHAQARYGEALHEAARELLGMWLTWAGAEQALALADQNAKAAQASVEAVDKRVRAGDASRLELGLVRGELLEQQRQTVHAQTQARVAWSHLSSRFPGITRQALALPEPVVLPADHLAWTDRILAQSDELKIAQTEAARAQSHAERAQADQTPDPTIGLFHASEAAGRERITGVSISVPLSGEHRSLQVARNLSLAESARLNADTARQALLGEIRAAFDLAQGSRDSWRLAQDNAAAMADNAKLVQRAYSLGEVDLQTLLLSRRQATQAAQSALEAQVEAVRAYEMLRVDAHWVWDLDHED
jgi:cobalt-zinc-cadmium efflux system outer membrane protein